MCDGNNAALGCDGQCFSGLAEDCRGVCGGKSKVDDCGVCDGNNKAQPIACPAGARTPPALPLHASV